jgi:7-carboxy-7-deazaguanine synthase
MTKFRYSEIFGNTFQGEGRYTGIATIWVRFWGCNFNCSGFGQEKPEDPSSWVLEYQDIDVTKYKAMEDLPVFSHGCDSSYSWSKKFAHLAHQGTPEEITTKLRSFLINEHNPAGLFKHPQSGQWTHLAFTGGEPMMSQTGIVAIMRQFEKEVDYPAYVTVETNGTQMPRENFVKYLRNGEPIAGEGFYECEKLDMITSNYMSFRPRGKEWFWSVSPKLYLSGEHWDEAIQPKVVRAYKELSDYGQLKYVSNGTQRAWDEVERATDLYRQEGIEWPVWIMPVGADIEGQNKVAAKVAEEAIKRGYNVAARVHTYVFGNVIGK